MLHEPTPPKSHEISNLIVQKTFVLTFFVFPYGTLAPEISAILLNGMALMGIFHLLANRHYPRLRGLAWFHLSALTWLSYSLSGFYSPTAVIGQANHFVQFALLTVFLVPAFQNSFALSELLKSRAFRLLLSLSTAVSWLYSYDSTGTVHEFAPNSLMLLLSLLFGMRIGISMFIGLLVFVMVFSLSGRFSPFTVILILTINRIISLPSIAVKLGAITIILLPIWVYLTLSTNELIELKFLDHNSYIRAEFIRSAWTTLQESMMLGQGFGPSYRPQNYAYQTNHILLRNPEHLSSVSNHHSIFDTAYRLGIPMTAFFVWVVFLKANVREHSHAKGLLLVLATGMSINAWFENQNQMPMVAFIVAYLISLGQTGRKKERT